ALELREPPDVPERRQRALDHFVGCGQADSKMSRRVHDAAWQNEDVVIGQVVPQLRRVAFGPFAPQIKGAFRRQDLITVSPQYAHQPIAPTYECGLIDR